jgi:hypothetical protein
MKNSHQNAAGLMNIQIDSRIWWSLLRFSFVVILVVLACIALATAAQARQPSEDRGNGNSAAEDVDALNPNTTGSDNTAHGWSSLFSNTTGSSNTADGFQAIYSNTIGSENTANGGQALLGNISGSGNTANGFQALYSNISGDRNTANGTQALQNNTSGQLNVANGYQALYNSTTGNQNTAGGSQALYYNTTGAFNTAYGTLALASNTTGRNNTAIGDGAGLNLTTGDGNVYIGHDVRGVANEYDTTRIRNIYFRLATERAVYVNSDNKLGTLFSTRRVKDDIKPMDKASEAILALKPVTFHYKKELEPNGRIQFGLIAEEVAEVNPDLVILDKEGKPESVRYEAINTMLLNEFLKDHKKVEEQQTAIRRLKSDAAKQEAAASELKKSVGILTAQLKEQALQIQKVSAQVQMREPITSVALSKP